MTIRDIGTGLDPDDANIVRSLVAALRNYGLLFPETEADLEALRKRVEQFDLSLPSQLDDPMQLLMRGRVRRAGSIGHYSDSNVEGQLSQAAREGGEIDPGVQAQMKKDRNDAEEAASGTDAQ